MLAIEVEFLMGRAVMTHGSQRDAAEWPPHPQRLFSALVAVQSELEMGLAGEAALKWLEELPPPQIRADLNPSFRDRPSHWVPVNDETVKADKGQTDFRHPLERRVRQERFFPAVVPADPTVVFQWPHAEGVERHRPVLNKLVENMSYLGHSASPVRACLRDVPVEPSLWPSADGDDVLRVPGPGRLARLQAVYRLRLEDESIQPPLGRMAHYKKAVEVPQSVFSPSALTIVFTSGPKLGLDSTLPLMQHFRDALLSRLKTVVQPALSGHGNDGKPTTEPHLAYVPLGFVNAQHSDGSLKGIALVLPRGIGPEVRRRLTSVVEEAWQLHLGVLGSLSLRLHEDSIPDLESLRFEKYTASSSMWASVTPIVLDRHPKKKGPAAEDIVTESCIRIGLPAPAEVRLGAVAAVRGVPRAQDFHGTSKQTQGRIMQHAILRFHEPVCGPVLLGAGRFMGLGLCLPYGRGGRR